MLEMEHYVLRFIITMKHVIHGAILSAARDSRRALCLSVCWSRYLCAKYVTKLQTGFDEFFLQGECGVWLGDQT